jgi:hypothetical protein
MTESDLRWIARKIARLNRDHLAAIVARAQLTDPADADYLVDTLMQRRAAILAAARLDRPENQPVLLNLKK